MTTLELALKYLKSGLSIIPILDDGSKRPACPWKMFQAKRPTIADCERWWGNSNYGIAIIGGQVSGGLEVLDFDSLKAFDAWKKIIIPNILVSLDLLPVIATPDSGHHVYYRTRKPQGNQKLALGDQGQVEIETRGTGGYVIAPGSPPECHPSKRIYKQIAGPSLLQIPLIEDL